MRFEFVMVGGTVAVGRSAVLAKAPLDEVSVLCGGSVKNESVSSIRTTDLQCM